MHVFRLSCSPLHGLKESNLVIERMIAAQLVRQGLLVVWYACLVVLLTMRFSHDMVVLQQGS